MGERDLRIASRIARKFVLLQCKDCAASIIKALGRESGARVIRIRPVDGSEFIGLVGTNDPIAQTGYHVGVRVGRRIFDNLHHEGVPGEEWAGRFFTQSGAAFVMEERAVGDFFGARFRWKQFRSWVLEG